MNIEKTDDLWIVELSSVELLALVPKPNQTVGEAVVDWAKYRILNTCPETQGMVLEHRIVYIGHGWFRVKFSSSFVT